MYGAAGFFLFLFNYLFTVCTFKLLPAPESSACVCVLFVMFRNDHMFISLPWLLRLMRELGLDRAHTHMLNPLSLLLDDTKSGLCGANWFQFQLSYDTERMEPPSLSLHFAVDVFPFPFFDGLLWFNLHQQLYHL